MSQHSFSGFHFFVGPWLQQGDVSAIQPHLLCIQRLQTRELWTYRLSCCVREPGSRGRAHGALSPAPGGGPGKVRGAMQSLMGDASPASCLMLGLHPPAMASICLIHDARLGALSSVAASLAWKTPDVRPDTPPQGSRGSRRRPRPPGVREDVGSCEALPGRRCMSCK